MDYDPEYYFRWRKYKEFSSGIISDLLPHKLHSLAYVMGADRPPKSVSCMGGIYVHPDRTVGDTVVVNLDYGDQVMILTGSTCNERGLEDLIRGHKASLYIGGGSVRVVPERPYVDEIDAITESAPGGLLTAGRVHMKEFIDSMRSRKPPTWDVVSTYNVMTAIAMAEVSYLEGRTVHYDADAEQIS